MKKKQNKIKLRNFSELQLKLTNKSSPTLNEHLAQALWGGGLRIPSCDTGGGVRQKVLNDQSSPVQADSWDQTACLKLGNHPAEDSQSRRAAKIVLPQQIGCQLHTG